jgi:RHS repeat-associated protein
MDVPEAEASLYQELDTYYYSTDLIGRPFELRDSSRSVTWHEEHYPFGMTIEEGSTTMTAGGGDYQVEWVPHFRFPGQYEDDSMGMSATGESFSVQNHYREYMPILGRYNRVDPISTIPLISRENTYSYSHSSPSNIVDFWGLQTYPVGLPSSLTSPGFPSPTYGREPKCCRYEHFMPFDDCYDQCKAGFPTGLIQDLVNIGASGTGVAAVAAGVSSTFGYPLAITGLLGSAQIPAQCALLCNPLSAHNRFCAKLPPCDDDECK